MTITTRLLAAAMLVLAACRPAAAPGTAPAPDASVAPALDRVREDELRRDLFALAGDAMRGREAGTLDEMRAAAWVAERAREAGLEPAGEDGTYFQFFPVRRTRVSSGSRVAVGGRALELWRDAVVLSPIEASVDAPLVWVGDATGEALAALDVRGKVAVAIVTAPRNPPAPGMSLWERRYTGTAVRERGQMLARYGAAAVILLGDSISDRNFEMQAPVTARGGYALDTGVVVRAGLPRPAGTMPTTSIERPDPATTVTAAGPVPMLWMRRSAEGWLRQPGLRLTATLSTEVFMFPSANVVARARGTDAALANEHVLFSGHHDHDGVRAPVDGDSIYNGADDEATVSVGLLAIARAWTARPARRPALFVWHGAEERGLLGSRWYVEHPTVPKGSIAAVLNADMIGRNHPDTAALLGVTPPHLNSRALADAAYAANRMPGLGFVVDTTWDAPSHMEGWYFRSDHLPYARAGIPAIFFTTLLHADYHTPKDEPERIDIRKLARMSRWMYATGWIIGNAPSRPGVEAGFRLER